MSNKFKERIDAVDLFCGAGGLTNGLQRSGIDVRLGIDVDSDCSFPYTTNNKAKFLLKPVEKLKSDDIKPVFRKNSVRLLAGCAPCQTFSSYNGKASSSDKRWWLLLKFMRLVQKLSPELVTMENVPRLINKDVFGKFVKGLENSGYKVSFQIVNCAEYGIPQQRRRLVLLASKYGPVRLLSPQELRSKLRTVRKTIGTLPPLKAGESCRYDPLHHSANLSDLNLKRIKASRSGSTWRDWDPKLVARCHKKKTGKNYISVYGRMCWDEPAPTITTQFYGFGNGRFGHPEQDRAISLREGAILQGFPKKYRFTVPGEAISRRAIGNMIGNAVPIKLGECCD